MPYIGQQPAPKVITSSDLADDVVTADKIGDTAISGFSALGAEPADTDELLVSDAGTLKRMDYSYIKGGGITEADQWRLTTNQSIGSTSDAIITANLERVDTAPQGYLTAGSGMSQSSGVFTFPSTGIWLVRSNIQYYVTDKANRYAQTFIHGTTDNFSSVDNKLTENGTNIPAISGANYIDVSGQTLVDCTDTSNIKVKFGFNIASTSGSPAIYGSSTANRTYFTFIRLGDT